eukprot:TRINITY_DN39022_c0_g1_i1.p1 TRINITY_DN39022_c0_g1~~TRINITY_DN39022_c0_g1_i1.p1  ORF type:complete len:269 (+),score=33.50 TRINITY_DN39022_c0_g1_i1:90-896(+)
MQNYGDQMCLNHGLFMDPITGATPDSVSTQFVIRAWSLRWLRAPGDVAWVPKLLTRPGESSSPVLRLHKKVLSVGKTSFELLYNVDVEGPGAGPLCTMVVACACAEDIGTPSARAAPVPAWMKQNELGAANAPEHVAADRALLSELRAAPNSRPPVDADAFLRWTVLQSEEDWYNRHTNQGSYARRAEDAMCAWNWPVERASAFAVSYLRETFVNQNLELQGDPQAGLVRISRDGLICCVAKVEFAKDGTANTLTEAPPRLRDVKARL